ncbi:WecB/TagA/CpsF family glycosyltransferase [Pseudomonadales bacterium]|nr:WecB/TagA/CpsF family glycosyltransferase [Pseudomonadales bacterium]
MYEDTIAQLMDGGLTAVFNTESAWYFFNHIGYRDYINGCTNIAIDGIGLKLALRLRGLSVERFHGPNLCEKLIESKSHYGNSILVVGGHDENQNLVKCGKIEGYFPLPMIRDVSDVSSCLDELLLFIKRFKGRKVIFVSLGLPKQELFCKWLHDSILMDSRMADEDIVLVPVGAAVDFLSGHRTRSGKIWQNLGLEWLPRLIREPRMFVRILRSMVAMTAVIFDLRAIRK